MQNRRTRTAASSASCISNNGSSSPPVLQSCSTTDITEATAAASNIDMPKSSALIPSNPDVNATAAAAPAPRQVPIKCPRCDSLNTKFCYFNNYSQTQPRHFCKSCRRYWTEGGTLRNVPVGGGCRKNKRTKQRPLLNQLGAAAGVGLLDPSSLIDDTTSNLMLARQLSNITGPFPNLISSCALSLDCHDTSPQPLNKSFSRFPAESMWLPRQYQPSTDQSLDATSYLDMSYPALVQRESPAPSHSCGACGSHVHSIHHGTCGGSINTFDSDLGVNSRGLPIKMEHEVDVASFRNTGYELNPIYHDQSVSMAHMVRTSATTATLASIENQLSSFCNMQHVDTNFSSRCMEENSCRLMVEGLMGNMASGPLDLLEHVENVADTMVETRFVDETKERPMHGINMLDDKPLPNTATNNELSSNMMHSTTDSNWQTPSVMVNDMLLESHHGM